MIRLQLLWGILFAVSVAITYAVTYDGRYGWIRIFPWTVAIVGWGSMYFHRALGCERQPLVYTARCKRLLTAHAIVCLAVVLLAWKIGKLASESVASGMLFLPLVMTGDVLWCELSLLIMILPERMIARNYLRRCKKSLASYTDMIVVGITGSFGKTSVKQIAQAILSVAFSVYATPQNYNTPMGVCKSVQNLSRDTQIFLVEMGARKVGDIAELCDLVHPSIGILTGIAPQHLETFGTIESIARTKGELVQALSKDGFLACGTATSYERAWLEQASCATCRVGDGGYIRATDIVTEQDGTRFTLHIGKSQMECQTCLLGAHNVQNILLACAVADHLGMKIEQIALGIARIKPIAHRLQLLQTAGGVTVLDDSYNANENGVRAAVEVLKAMQRQGRIVVAAQGIAEQGARSDVANYAVGAQIASVADLAIWIGPYASDMQSGALAQGMRASDMYQAENLAAAQELFAKLLRKGDILWLQNDLTDDLYGIKKGDKK